MSDNFKIEKTCTSYHTSHKHNLPKNQNKMNKLQACQKWEKKNFISLHREKYTNSCKISKKYTHTPSRNDIILLHIPEVLVK